MTIYPEVTFEGDQITLNSGQIISRTHLAGACYGEFCPIHNPSDHELRGELLFFNGRHMIRRVGEDFFIDPDDYAFGITGKAIIRNSATCALCGDQIQSTNRHDFRECKCGEIFVDGGFDYIRRGAKDLNNIIDTSVTVGDVL